MVKEFFQREEADRKWKKKEEPDSARLAVGRKGSDKLNKSATENSTASPLSQRTVNTLTSDGHETPPENPATELNTNSTPNTPDHSSVQQTPADETPQVPEKCCLSHLPLLRRITDQFRQPKRFLPNSSPSNDQTDALTKAGALHEDPWTLHALPTNPTVAAITRRQHATGAHTQRRTKMKWGPQAKLIDEALLLIYLCYLDIYLYNIQKVVKTHNIT